MPPRFVRPSVSADHSMIHLPCYTVTVCSDPGAGKGLWAFWVKHIRNQRRLDLVITRGWIFGWELANLMLRPLIKTKSTNRARCPAQASRTCSWKDAWHSSKV